jgi:branched-chain amino acid aminotransferase
MPATKINGLNIGGGRVGEITKKIINKWSKNVGVDIIQQIKKFDEGNEGEKTVGPSPYSFTSQ